MVAKRKKRRRSERQQVVTLAVILAVVTLILYGQVIVFDFINLDDPDYVYNNENVTSGITVENVVWAFTLHGPGQWHPLTWLSHQLDCQVFGVDAEMHHLVNALFHMANVVLLFLLLFRMTSAMGPSFLVAALFGWHPLSVESVAWISERRDVLSTFFCILTLHAYVSYTRQGGWRAYSGVMFLFACGLMSKPMLVTLPCVMLLLDGWPLKRWQQSVVPNSGPAVPVQRLLLLKTYAWFAIVAGSLAFLLMIPIAGTYVAFSSWGTPSVLTCLAGLVMVSIPGLFLVSGVKLLKSFPEVPPSVIRLQVPCVLGGIVLTGTFCRHLLMTGNTGTFFEQAMFLFFTGSTLLAITGLVYLVSMTPMWSRAWLVREKMPLLGLSLVASLFTFVIQMQEQAVGTFGAYPMTTRLANATVSYATYLRKLVWPHDLTIFYPYPKSLDMLWVGISALLLLVLSGLCIWQVRRRPYLLIGWLWYLGTLVPVIGLVQVGGQAMADRYTYVPLIGIHMAVAWALMEFVHWLQPGNSKRQAIFHGLIASVVLVPLLAVSFQQVGYWKSNRSLYQRALEVNKDNVLALNSLGAEYLEVYEQGWRQRRERDEETLDKSRVYFSQANKLNPDRIQSWLGMARICEVQKEPEPAKALRYLQEARERNQVEMAKPIIFRRLAWVLAAAPEKSVRNGPEALKWAEQCVQLTAGQDADCLHTLAVALAENQQFEKAINVARRASSLARENKQEELVEQIKISVEGYGEKKPFRDPRW